MPDEVDLSIMPDYFLAWRAVILTLMCIDSKRVKGEESEEYQWANDRMNAMVDEMNERFNAKDKA